MLVCIENLQKKRKGFKKMKKELKITVSVSLHPDILGKVDKKRGNIPRSEYLREIITKEVEKEFLRAV